MLQWGEHPIVQADGQQAEFHHRNEAPFGSLRFRTNGDFPRIGETTSRRGNCLGKKRVPAKFPAELAARSSSIVTGRTTGTAKIGGGA